jgi:hypothetical protein
VKVKGQDKKEAITAVKWDVSSPTASWKWKGETVKRTYGHPPFKVLLLKDRRSVIIIASTKDEGVENAAVYNADGSLRYRLVVPSIRPKIYGFYDVYYSRDKLTLILITGSRDYPYDTGCTFDAETGGMTNFHNVK